MRRNALQAALGALVWLAIAGYWFYQSFHMGFCDHWGAVDQAFTYCICALVYFALVFLLSLCVRPSYPLIVLIAFTSAFVSNLCLVERQFIIYYVRDGLLVGSVCYLLVHCWFSRAPMISRMVQISAALVVLLTAVVVRTGYERWACGHKRYFRYTASELLQLYYEPHTCDAATRLQLCRDVYKAQCIHKQQFGAYATSLNQLERLAFIRFKSDRVSGTIECNFSPTSWAARMGFCDGGGVYSVTEAGIVWFEDENMIGPTKRIITDLH